MNRQNELGVLRIVLEEQYERHSTQLALLDRQARRMRSDGGDLGAASALTAATRRALGDIARALHYLEQGHYGSCEGCDRDIPIEELAHRPATRFCVTCQPAAFPRAAHSRRTTPTTGGAPREGMWPKAGAPSRSDRCRHRTGPAA
ncbi:TraR/DksA C4-type zinc finger protein [Micromonospora sp. NPDC048170]|uniref:TraR/DksA C4-type zinc finger protein n=1 Tax=Micromonospora sp. NPDC048170 TaxID=3154819 RepID=UPI003400F8DB